MQRVSLSSRYEWASDGGQVKEGIETWLGEIVGPSVIDSGVASFAMSGSDFVGIIHAGGRVYHMATDPGSPTGMVVIENDQTSSSGGWCAVKPTPEEFVGDEDQHASPLQYDDPLAGTSVIWTPPKAVVRVKFVFSKDAHQTWHASLWQTAALNEANYVSHYNGPKVAFEYGGRVYDASFWSSRNADLDHYWLDRSKWTGSMRGNADLVYLVAKDFGSTLGLAWLGAHKEMYFTGVVSIKGLKSGEYVLAHELGHSLMARHDPYTRRKYDRVSNITGSNHGYVQFPFGTQCLGYWCAPYGYRDVMAYDDECRDGGGMFGCQILPAYSKELCFYGGMCFGSSVSDAQPTILNWARRVMWYR